MSEAPTFEAALAELRKDHRNVSLPGLVATYVALLVVVPLPALAGWPEWSWLLLWPLIGWLQYRVVISGHEAVHKTLCWPEGLNEALGVVGQALVGVNFAAYRLQHLDHHKALSEKDDPDAHIYAGIIRTPRGWRRFLVWTLGTFVEILVKIRQKGTGGYGTRETLSPEVKRQKILHTIGVFAAQLALLSLCGLLLGARGLQDWWMFPAGWLLIWFGPLSIVAVFLNRSRILIEHGLAIVIAESMAEPFGGRRIPTVDIVPNALEKELFAPFSFNYHCCHHLFMTVPHYNLDRLRALCKEHGISGYHEVQGSYLSALKRTMQA